MSPRFLLSISVFLFLFCAWSHGAYISNNPYDKPAYNNVAYRLEREYRNTPDFKIQRSYFPDEDDKRGEEDPTIERTTLRAGHYQPEPDQSSERLITAKRNRI